MAMFSEWVIGISLIAKSTLGRVLAEDSKATQSLNSHVNSVKTNYAGLGKVIDRTMIGIGLASAATFAIGIKGASELQDALTQTAIAMGRTTQYVDQNFTAIATKMSMRTAQSVSQSMGILRTMATSGINDPAQLKSLAMPIAMYADTQFLLKGTPFDKSAAIAAKIAHEFGARTASQLDPILNSLFKISNDMPDSMASMAQQLKYYAPKFAEKGVSSTEILKLQATADRMGYGTGKSGTGFLQIYRNLLHPTTSAMAAAQSALGITGAINAKGVFDPEFLFTTLNKDSHGYQSAGRGKIYDQLLNSAFTSNSGLIAGVLSSDAGRAQYANVGQTMQRVHDMDSAQSQAMATLSKQTILLGTNFQSLATFIAKPWMQDFTNAISKLAAIVGSWASFMQSHQDVAKVVGGGMMASAAYAFVRMAMMMKDALHGFMVLGRFGPRIGISERLLPHSSGSLGRAVGGAGLAEEAGGAAVLGVVGRAAAGLFRGAIGMLGLQSLRGAFTDIGKVVELFRGFGAEVLTTRGGLALLGGIVGRLGLRILPIVGELLLLHDVLEGLVGGISWMNKNVFHMPDKAHLKTPVVSTPALVAAHIAAFQGNMVGGHGRATARPPVNIENVHVHANDAAGGKAAGAAFASYLRTAGLIRNAPITPGFGNAVPAGH